MAKNLIQDVVMPSKKKAGDKISARKPAHPVAETKEKTESRTKDDNIVIERPEKKVSLSLGSFHPPKKPGLKFLKNKTVLYSAGGIILAGIAAFVFSAYFSKASVSITQRTDSTQIKIPLTASKTDSSGIPFEIVVVKGSETKQVKSTGTKNVENKASGRIVIYNNYSSASQKLVKSTRFEATNGKIYRISGDVTVPGISNKGGEPIPGSVEVTVYADKAGDAYNQGLTDFTIPGFKGDPKFNKFYARSKTEMTGGFSGPMPVASDKDTASAKTSLESSLRGDLLSEAGSQVPDDYILYRDAVQINYDAPKNTSAGNNTVSITENGTLVGVLLKKSDLSALVSKSISSSGKNNMPFTVNGVDNLIFSFGQGIPMIDQKTKDVPFVLSGEARFTYTAGIDSLKKDLAGSAKADFSNILSKYPAVYKAQISEFQPFWGRYFPKNPDKISIDIAK